MVIDPESDLPDLETASRNFLVVAPAPPDTKLFDNFSKVVNHYLEAPPFNYRNSFKNISLLKHVCRCVLTLCLLTLNIFQADVVRFYRINRYSNDIRTGCRIFIDHVTVGKCRRFHGRHWPYSCLCFKSGSD